MPAKMAQISPLGRRSGCQDYGRRPRRQAVLSKRGNSAKIHPGLGFIWGIPAQTHPRGVRLVRLRKAKTRINRRSRLCVILTYIARGTVKLWYAMSLR